MALLGPPSARARLRLLGALLLVGAACSVDGRVLSNDPGNVSSSSSSSAGSNTSDVTATSGTATVDSGASNTTMTSGGQTNGSSTTDSTSTTAGGGGTTNSASDTSASSTSGNTGGSVSVTSTSSTTGALVECPVTARSYTCPAPPVGGNDPLVANMDGGELGPAITDGRSGWWGFWGDTSGGTFTPSAVENLVVSEGTEYFVRLAGQGFTDWGATLAAALFAPEVTGDGLLDTCPYDASRYAGVRFRARGSGPELHFTIQIEAVADANAGGTCQATDDAECTGRHGTLIDLTSSWKTFEVTWDMMEDPTWGCTAAFDPSRLMLLQWDFYAGDMFELDVDDIEFIVP